ncbi:hypothetical protein, partial [Arthrobacter sp. JCM 19049]|uniref:hypothetical protein n=1 Tax=Arthrobacter sp. JCM 19049 TaxID=1460643 RepID=UPI000AEB34BF
CRPAQLPVPLPDEDSRLLGHGLSATGQRGPNKEQLAYARDGKILWKQPYEKAFATGYSSDSGWTWTLASEPSDTLVAAVRAPTTGPVAAPTCSIWPATT